MASKADLATALKRFKFGTNAENSQRQRELQGLRFFAGDQWPDYIRTLRAGEQVAGASGVETVGKKPCLTINKVKQPVQQIINQEKNADLGILIRAEKDASIEDAKIRQGLIRHIQAHSRARIARGWAYERSAQVGRGYYRIDKEYLHKTRKVLDADPASLMDQELVVSRILNQGNVLLDPFAKQPDWSDGNWAFVWDDMPYDDFVRKYGKDSALKNLDDKELTAVAEQQPGWIGGDEEARTIRVAEYWYASYDPVTVRVLSLADGSSILSDMPEKEWPEGAKAGSGELEIQDRQIHWCKITAKDILEETDWEGTHIPIIPTIGNEYNLNGERLWNGEVEDAQDAQRLFNYTASAIAVATAIAPLSPFILDPTQIEGYEAWWKQANVKTFPYLPARTMDEQGRPYPEIRRQTAEPPIQALALMLSQSDSYIQATTSTPDTSLGRFDPKKASGKAISALQQQSELANSNYLDNLAHITMSLEGIILNEMLQYVYDRPGRVVQILGETGDPQQVMLNQPFVKNQQGQPVAAPEPTNGQQDVQHYDLSKGTFSVVVDVTKSAPTRRAESSAAIGDLIQADPQLAQLVGDLWIGGMDFPEAQAIAARLKKLLPAPLQENGAGGAAMLQQQNQQLVQQVKLLAQELDAKTKLVEQEVVQGQTEIQIAQINADARIRVAQIAAVSAGVVAETKVNAAAAELVFEKEVEAIGQRTDQQHEHIQGQMDRSHEQDLAAQQAAAAQAQQAQALAAQPTEGA